MMYILVEEIEDYYTIEHVHVLDTFDELYTKWEETPIVTGMYEVTREINPEQLRAEQIERARVRMAKHEEAMKIARQVLTPQQLKDLGLG